MDQFESDDEPQGRPGAPVDFGRLLHAVFRHWRWIPIAGAVGAVLGLLYATLVMKPEYTARTTILWEPGSGGVSSGADGARSFLTQVDSIKLPGNLAEIKQRLKLAYPMPVMKEKIGLAFDNGSQLVQIEVTDGSAKGAMTLANTTVDVFLEYQRRVGRARGEEHLQAIEADFEVAQAQLKNARDAYDAFRKELGVSDFQLETQLAIQRAADLKQQAEMSSAEALSEEARQKQIVQEATRAPTTTSGGTSISNPDAVALAQLRTQLTAARSHLAADHPQVLQLEAQVQALEARVKSGTNTVQGATTVMPNQQVLTLRSDLSQSKVSKEAAAMRQETYRRYAQEAEKRLQQLSEAEGQAQQLLSRIALLETRVTELEAQRVRVRDEVRNAGPEFRVVAPATLPEMPNASKRRSIAVRFPLVAIVLALGVILLIELRGLRVHTAREAGFWANAAVVASSTWPHEQNMLGVLVDELSDAAPSARGTTLVVGARVNEIPIAREIAYWLSHLSGWSPRGAIGANEPVMEAPAAEAAQDDKSVPAGGAPASTGDRLARHSSADAIVAAQAWDGPPHGPSLRRAARLADRVLVVVAAGTMSVAEIAQLRSRLGRESGIGLLLVGLNPDFVRLPDRVGEVDAFWQAGAA